MVLACVWAGRGRGPADGIGLRVRGLWSDTGCGGYEGRVPVSICSPGLEVCILVFFSEGFAHPSQAGGPCSLGGLCGRNRGISMEIAEKVMGSAGGGADRGPLGCQSDPGTSPDET